MITFDQDGVRFNYRVAGICLEQQHVLLHQLERDAFWALPGGRPEMGESSRQALAREMREEMHLTVEIGRLLWCVENFFTLEGRRFHELALYYHIALPKGCPQLDVEKDFRGWEGTTAITFRWFAIAALPDVPLYPTFLRSALAELPDGPVHLIHEDG